ncbi:MAG: helix-turn-helix protein [Candidatus Saccharibacteria bacterium]|nr:helix-turn-helix protein [Candidatus Saccharibacteria bacterium]
MRNEELKAYQGELYAQLLRDMEAAAQEKALRKTGNFSVQRHAMAFTVFNARRKAGLTQATLATRAGVAQQAIARLESGRANPSLTTILKVYRALDVNIQL